MVYALIAYVVIARLALYVHLNNVKNEGVEA